MVDLLDEVKEDLRDEKTLKGLKLLSIVLAVALIISLGGVAGWTYYKSMQEKAHFAEGKRYNDVLMEATFNKPTNFADLQKKFEVVFKESKTNFGALAGFQIAQIHLVQKNPLQAIATLSQFAEMEHIDKSYREFAELMLINLQRDNNKITQDEYVAKIETFSAQNNFLKYSAEELLAVAKIDVKKFQEATQLLSLIQADKNVPITQAKRAMQLSRLVVAENINSNNN